MKIEGKGISVSSNYKIDEKTTKRGVKILTNRYNDKNYHF